MRRAEAASSRSPGRSSLFLDDEGKRRSTMRQRVAAIFETREAAERAANALVDLGADRDQISMLTRGHEGAVATAPDRDAAEAHEFIEPARWVGDAGAPLTTTDEEEAAQGAATGAAIGAVAGLA